MDEKTVQNRYSKALLISEWKCTEVSVNLFILYHGPTSFVTACLQRDFDVFNGATGLFRLHFIARF